MVVHGGPGSGSSAGTRRLFDPGRYRIVLFDHVGAGGSDLSAFDRERYSDLRGYAEDVQAPLFSASSPSRIGR